MSLRIGIIRDYREEDWPSMDLSADQLLRHWPTNDGFPSPVDVAPEYRRLAARIPVFGATRLARNLDRARNRYRLLPNAVRKIRDDFDFFHVVDHSYAHIVHELPPGRSGVYCHDLDTFRCLLEPTAERRSPWFRRIAFRVLEGMRNAAIVFHSTEVMGRLLAERCSIPTERLCHAPLGADDEFFIASSTSNTAFSRRLPAGPFVLHVGSCIARKRIDVLLNVFAQLRSSVSELRLVKIGGNWTPAQTRQIADMQLQDAVVNLGKVDRSAIGEAYQRAAITLVPSEAEGFGLPVIEALACGGAVLASDLPTLREAGGDAAYFAPVGDVEAWRFAAEKILSGSSDAATVQRRKAWARQFSWSRHARIIASAYCRPAKLS